MGGRTYRLEVEGELGDLVDTAFRGMSVWYHDGNTVLVGLVRDQAELGGLLQRVWDLGLTLRSVTAMDAAKAIGTAPSLRPPRRA